MINMGEYDLMSAKNISSFPILIFQYTDSQEELKLVEIADCPSSEFW